MGLDANTQIWVGFKENPHGDLGGIIALLPDHLYNELREYGVIEISGLEFRMFNHADEPIGFGVELLDQGWRNGPTKVDLAAMAKKVREMMPRVIETLKTVGITNEPNVWLATNL